MDAQELFNRFASELLSEGKTTLTEFADFTTVFFSYNAFKHSHAKALQFALIDLELKPIHILTDNRKQILIDLQLVSRRGPSNWPEDLRDLAAQYKLRWSEDFFVKLPSKAVDTAPKQGEPNGS